MRGVIGFLLCLVCVSAFGLDNPNWKLQPRDEHGRWVKAEPTPATCATGDCAAFPRLSAVLEDRPVLHSVLVRKPIRRVLLAPVRAVKNVAEARPGIVFPKRGCCE